MAKTGKKNNPDSNKRQANSALSSHFRVTPAGRCSLGSQPFQSTRGKEQLCGATTLSCPLLPWLVLVLKGPFLSVTDGRDLYVQSVLEFTQLPLSAEKSAWETWHCFLPIHPLAFHGMEKSSSYLPSFLEAKGMRGNGRKSLTWL